MLHWKNHLSYHMCFLQHIAHPLLGDEAYGSNAQALHVLARNRTERCAEHASATEALCRSKGPAP